MGKKKRKKTKTRKGAHREFDDLTKDQLLEKGRQTLEAGKFRDAITLLKIAKKKYGPSGAQGGALRSGDLPPDEIGALLFRAYVLRERQLREKGMTVEADTVGRQAREHMPRPGMLAEDDLLMIVSSCSDKEGFDLYGAYAASNGASPAAERLLAHRLLRGGPWEVLDSLDEALPIRRDAPAAARALPLMDAGKWEDALDALGTVSRSSPFASFRMFCRAMVCFYREDDRELGRVLSMIPSDFPLNHVVENLRDTVGNGGCPSHGATRLPCLWDGPVGAEDDIRKLLDDLENRRFPEAEESLADIAEALYPRNPETARSFMLEILWNMTLRHKLGEYDFQKMVRHLLSEDRADLLMAKIRLATFRSPFSAAGRYISLLGKEFRGAESRKMAHAFVLRHTAEGILKTGADTAGDRRGLARYGKLLGVRGEDHEMILVDMLTEAIRLDPLNPKGYALLAALPRSSRPAKNSVEAVLTAMLDRFPDDPWPCLELATLFYEKNAFRKAENILAEAMTRAPHDNRVIDRHVLALLISAEKNIRRKKFHLVARDMERAERFDSKTMTPFVMEKRMLFRLLNDQEESGTDAKRGKQFPLPGAGKDPRGFVESEIASLSLPERLRVMALLVSDIGSHVGDRRKSLPRKLGKLFDRESEKIEQLSPSELPRLLAPLEKTLSPLFPSRDVASVFLEKNKNILREAEDSEVIALYDLIMAPRWLPLIMKDIRRRLKRKKGQTDHRLVMEFYLVAIRHIQGEVRDPDLFEDIADMAEEPMIDALKAASRRLSRHASGILKKALEMFDFRLLDQGFFMPDMTDDDFDDFLPPFMEDEDDPGQRRFQDLVTKLVILSEEDMTDPQNMDRDFIDGLMEDFEVFVDDVGARGVPIFVADELGKVLRSDPRIDQGFAVLSRVVATLGIESRLSREAQAILFGKAGRRTNREK